MIYHVREEEKKKIIKLIEQLKGLEEETLSLSSFYPELSNKVEITIDDSQLLKFLKKGRLNITEDKVIYSFKIKIEDLFEESILIISENDDSSGKTYLVSKFEGSYFEEKCSSVTYTKDDAQILSMLNVSNRVMFKLSEIVARVAVIYEKDKDTLKELEKVKNNLRWDNSFTSTEIEKSMNDLDNLCSSINSLGNNYTISCNFNTDLISDGFKKYRSIKDLASIKYYIDDVEYEDRLRIIKEDNKYFYELRLNKFDNYKKITDVVEVFERKELSNYGYERLIREMIPVFIDTAKNRITNLSN